MADPLSDFFENPSGETFVRLRNDVLADPSYDFNSTDLDELTDLLAAEEYDAVPDALPGLMPGWLLSPRVHLLAALAAEKSGNAANAELERNVVRACLRGLLQSGDGTPQRPYLITHITDEYDLLEHFGKRPTEQRE